MKSLTVLASHESFISPPFPVLVALSPVIWGGAVWSGVAMLTVKVVFDDMVLPALSVAVKLRM